MGFFKKLGRKMRGFFKRIGQGIKKGVQKFGKFMGKIGILGQIAMMFILPAIGGLMLRGLGSLTGLSGATAASGAVAAGGSAASAVSAAGGAATVAGQTAAMGTASGFTAAAAGSSSALAKGVAWTMKTAQRFANSPLLKPFKTVTDAVNSFMKNTVGYVGSKVGLGGLGKADGKWANFFDEAADDFWGPKGTDSVLARVGKSVTDNWDVFVGDMQKGNILMGGDTSLQRAWDAGKAFEAPISDVAMIDGIPIDEMWVSASDELTQSQLDYLDSKQPVDNLNFDTASVVEGGLDVSSTGVEKQSLMGRVGEGIQDALWEGEDSLLQNLRPSNMLGKVGTSILEAPGKLIESAPQQMLMQSVMGGGGGGGPYYGSTAGPVSTPGRDRAEQFAYANAMATAGASSQYFSSDYDIFTAVQNETNPYGTDMGGTWGNYMSKQLVA